MKENEDYILNEEKIIQAKYEELLSECRICSSDNSRKVLDKAFLLAKDAHKDVYRKTGEPFILHPIEVARIIVTEMPYDQTSIVCALLHDVVEDSKYYTQEDIREQFGNTVAIIVGGLTKIEINQREERNNGRESTSQSATLQKIILALNGDLRIVYIKLSDRLHNMRTLDGMPDNKKLIKGGETEYLYAPLALRLGMARVGRELEDLSFKHRSPEKYEQLHQSIQKAEPRLDASIDNFIVLIDKLLENYTIDYHIDKIRRSYYSTWKKMERDKLLFDDVYNYVSVRIVFNNNEGLEARIHAFLIYAIVTEKLQAKRASLRDMIKTPKSNGFEGLIVDLMFQGRWIELQIMSSQMDEIAEKGFISSNQFDPKKANDWQTAISDQIEEMIKKKETDLSSFFPTIHSSDIYVLTPKGDLMYLPKGATVLDFAFRIHSDLGLRFLHASINGKYVDYTYKVKRGEQIRIISSDNQMPQEKWLNYVVTPKARNSITDYLKRVRRNYVGHGAEVIRSISESVKINFSKEVILKLRKEFLCENDDDLFLKIGEGRLENAVLLKVLKNMHSPSIMSSIQQFIKHLNTKETVGESVSLFDPKKEYLLGHLVENQKYKKATCCNPIPGDSSIAYLSENKEIIIHNRDCPNAIQLNAEKGKSVVKVSWGKYTIPDHLVVLQVEGVDRKGLLLDILNHITNELDSNIQSVEMRGLNHVFRGVIKLYVPNKRLLDKLKSKISSVKGVTRTTRSDLSYR